MAWRGDRESLSIRIFRKGERRESRERQEKIASNSAVKIEAELLIRYFEMTPWIDRKGAFSFRARFRTMCETEKVR